MNRTKVTAEPIQPKGNSIPSGRIIVFLAIIACYIGFVGITTTTTGALASIRAQNNPPKNVIILIGDGMSQAYVDAASIYSQGRTGGLFMESAPHQAMMYTASKGGIVTDSAASGTAMATGQKVFNGLISMSAQFGGEELETSLEHFQNRCKSTGMVGSAYLNHATTAAFGAHAGSRTYIDEIAHDFFTETRPNVLLGGAASGITPEIAEENEYTVVTDRNQLNALVPAQNRYVSGQFGYGHMGYEYDDDIGGATFYASMPHLSEMTKNALNLLGQDNDGFFLLVEGSRIDHAGHENNIRRAIFETLEFDKAVQEVVTWAADRNDTLVIVTADHDTGGLSIIENKGQGEFPDVRWKTFAHTNADVPVFAWGPGSELVTGQLDNTDIHRITIANSGDAPEECPEPEENPGPRPGEDESGSIETITPTPTPSLTPTATPTFTPPPPTVTPTASPIPPLLMEIQNSPRAWVRPGQEITYVIDYEIGTEKLEDVALFSRMPDGVRLLPDSITAENVQEYSIDTVDGIDTIKWQFGTLSSLAKGQVIYKVQRLIQARNSDSGESVFGTKVIDVTKVGPDTVDANQLITYELTVTNISDQVLADIFVVDAVPYGASYVSGADAPPLNDEVSWWVDQLAPGESRALSYTVSATRSLMTRGYKVFNPEGLGVASYDVISTRVNDTPFPFDGDGVEIVNNGVWATWYHQGQFNVGRAEPIINPTYDFFIPLNLIPE